MDYSVSYSWRNSANATPQAPSVSHRAALGRLAALGFAPRMVYDIGAFHGDWSNFAAAIFPGARFALFEANPDREERLKAGRYPYFIAALSSRDRAEAPFYLGKDAHPSGASLYRERTVHFADDKLAVRSLPTRSLDSLVAEHAIPLPDFVKLDTQGAELEIIAGAAQAFANCAAMIVETSLLNFNRGAPLIADAFAALEARGLRCVDVCEVHGHDGFVVQLDLLFANRALFARYERAAALS
jgi:FkbM family methyltransferase